MAKHTHKHTYTRAHRNHTTVEWRFSLQAFEDDRGTSEAALQDSRSALDGERSGVQRARVDLDRFSARVSERSSVCTTTVRREGAVI